MFAGRERDSRWAGRGKEACRRGSRCQRWLNLSPVRLLRTGWSGRSVAWASPALVNAVAFVCRSKGVLQPAVELMPASRRTMREDRQQRPLPSLVPRHLAIHRGWPSQCPCLPGCRKAWVRLLRPGRGSRRGAQFTRHEPVHRVDHDHVGLAAKHGEGIEQGDRAQRALRLAMAGSSGYGIVGSLACVGARPSRCGRARG